MKYSNKPCLGNCNSYVGLYGLNNYLAVKPFEYNNPVENYSEKVDYSMQ